MFLNETSELLYIIAQCLASYFGDQGIIFYSFFPNVFQATTGNKFWGKNHGKNPETQKFDAKHLLLSRTCLKNLIISDILIKFKNMDNQ